MMKKTNFIPLSAAILSATIANAEPQVSGKVTFEAASFTSDGRTIGATADHEGGFFKKELAARVYVDGEVEKLDGATYHMEFQVFGDASANDNHRDNESYTQRELIRELYIDHNINDWAVRAGKQQVVWGKADGMKLLDIINPTDYSEMVQNQMEDSRIPVLTFNAEKINEDGSSHQVVLSQPRENIFAGLDRNITQGVRSNGAVTGGYTSTAWDNAANFSNYGANVIGDGHDTGHPFVLKGVDTITGKENGFLNIAPDLGTVASLFARAFQTAGTNDEKGFALYAHGGNSSTGAMGAHSGFTVGGFNTSATLGYFSYLMDAQNGASEDGFEDFNFRTTGFWRDNDGDLTGNGITGGFDATDTAAESGDDTLYDDGAGGTWSGQATLAAFAAKFDTNLHNTNSAIDSAFEYMDRTSFATFDTFVNATSEYVYDMPSDIDANIAYRYNNTNADGLNYSLAYSYNYDPNPVIDVSWRDSTGNEVIATRTASFATENRDSDASTSRTGQSNGAEAAKTAVVQLSGLGGNEESYATLRFTERLERAHNFGGAFDYAFDSKELGPIVIRAEGLYQKDVYSPVIDRGALAIGDITSALKMKPGDKFKYVLGADITALTNMTVSAQFIQERNLDFIDDNIDYDGAICNGTDQIAAENCGVYTADFATMHMSNGLKKGTENKEFVSLFLSKPFGESGQHRWNNIFMSEEGGGRWNRFDTEYTLNDNAVLTAEVNKYWGDPNTQFGQLEPASNFQLGVKYSF